MLVRTASSPQPAAGGAYWITSDWTSVSCLTSIQNGTGEGFLAIDSDGNTYRFDWMAVSAEQRLAKKKPGNGAGFDFLARGHFRLYATRVEDRFGNWVSYTYSNAANAPVKLDRIESSDGRVITLGYSGSRVGTVSAHGRSWTYGYSPGDSLTSVTLPDGSAWTLDLPTLQRLMIRYVQGAPGEPWRSCTNPGDIDELTYIGTVKHPSGAIGTFTLMPMRFVKHGIDYETNCAIGDPSDPNDDETFYPMVWDSYSVVSKALSGSGLASSTWLYAYSQGDATEVSGPSEYSKYTFGNMFRQNEGKLLKVERGASPSAILSVQDTAYELAQGGMPYPTPVGASPQVRQQDFGEEYVRPQKQAATTRQGVTFRSVVNSFDAYARPTSTTRSSTISGNPSRTEEMAYHDNTTLWVMGQVKKTTCVVSIPADAACDGQADSVVSEIGYSSYAQPLTFREFGKLVQTRTHDVVTPGQIGTIKTVKDGNNNITTLTNWKRGIPQSLAFADGNTQSAEVNDHGWITWVDDELNSRTCYAYDAMGRITEIRYTSESAVETCNTSTWAATTSGFTRSASAKYGLPAGHWQHAASTGNGRKVVYFDALWRPVVEEAFDNANAAATRNLTVRRYDASGRLAFQSYPLASLTNYADAGLKGTFTTYDALDRAVQVKQDWEGTGQLTTTTEYLAGFQTRVTNPRGQQITTSYLAWDQPIADYPRSISHPLSVFTDITRDAFGKPTQLTRRNAGNTSWQRRYFYYDAHQQLCKSKEQETGITAYGYDGAGNLTWSAAGLPWSSDTTCEYTATTAASRRVDRTYDARNRVATLAFPDGLGNTTYAYHPDGRLATVAASNTGGEVITTEYGYNRRRLPTQERMLWGTINRLLQWTYTANGHTATLAYPGTSALSVAFAPNALGQPTQAGPFATGVSYFPNGALKQFTYGNGIVHTLTQNARGLPDTSCDFYGSCNAGAVLNDGYDYDQNGNVAAISDGRTGNRGNRSLTYDALDRLTQAVSPMFGTASYSYDALDNLTRVQVGATAQYAARDHHYCYDAAMRLANVKTGSCSGATVMGLGYDVQGNLANRNGRAFGFDYGNRLRSVAASGGTAATTYYYDGHGRRVRDTTGASKDSLYDQSGQLLFVRDWRQASQTQYVYLGGSLVATRERADSGGAITVEYQHTDALGSPVAVTDASRNVLERSEHEPYGRVGNRSLRDGPGYTGHVEDAATALNYMQQRYYDPMLGVFLSVDPVTALSNPVGMFHRYRYAANNPYSYFDPDGRECEKVTGSNICGGRGFSGSVVLNAVSTSLRSRMDSGSGSRGQGEKTGSSRGGAAAAATAAGIARPIAGSGVGGSSVNGVGAFIRGLLGRAIITAPLVIGGDSRKFDRYVHYGYAADAEKFAGGLRPGGYATLPGLGYTGEQAQQMLALPHQLPPDSFYSIEVSPSIPVMGPMPVQPTIVPPRTGGGIEFIFPDGTPPGSVTGPYPLPGN